MLNRNRFSRRIFLKVGLSLLALIGPLVSPRITRVKAEPLAPPSLAYGSGSYGQGAYPGLTTYLPAVINLKD